MTRPLSALALLIAPTLVALAPTPVRADPGARAVAECRAEMLRAFPDGAVRSHRVGAIEGGARSTRVTLYVTADRRYTFECRTDSDGRVTVASLEPPRGGRTAEPAAGSR